MIQIYVVSNHAYTTNSETKNVPSPLLFFHWLLQPHRCTLISIPWKEWSMLDLCGRWNHSVFSRMLSFLRGLAAVGNFFFLRVCVCTLFFFFFLHNLLLRRVVPQMWLRTMRHRNVHINLPPSELVSNDMTDGGRDITDSSRCTRDNMFPDAWPANKPLKPKTNVYNTVMHFWSRL